jgi:hypothetical protein
MGPNPAEWKRITIWLALGIVPLTFVWMGAFTQPRNETQSRATARAIAMQLDGFIKERSAVVHSLAERFSQWESLPEAAVFDALQTAATQHLALRRLLVADTAGRLISGYDANQRLGQERLSAGGLDAVLGRRESLRRGGQVVVIPQGQAGALDHFELAAPIQRADGTQPAYVGASLSLEAIRRRLGRLAAQGLRFSVADRQGNQLFPCGQGRVSSGFTVRSSRFVVTVAATRRSRWGLALAASGGVVLLWLLLLGLHRYSRGGRPGTAKALADERGGASVTGDPASSDAVGGDEPLAPDAQSAESPADETGPLTDRDR